MKTEARLICMCLRPYCHQISKAKLEGEELLMVKKRLECIYIFYGLKISQDFEMEIFNGKMGRGNISRKILLKNSKGIC